MTRNCVLFARYVAALLTHIMRGKTYIQLTDTQKEAILAASKGGMDDKTISHVAGATLAAVQAVLNRKPKKKTYVRCEFCLVDCNDGRKAPAWSKRVDPSRMSEHAKERYGPPKHPDTGRMRNGTIGYVACEQCFTRVGKFMDPRWRGPKKTYFKPRR